MDTDEIKEEIRRRTDIAELISQYVPLTRAGQRMRARCPFHEERTPSFYADPAGGYWKCFGCGEGGDAFSFLMKIEGLTFPQAAERLAERVGLTWRTAPGADRAAEQRRQIQRAHDLALAHFQANLRGPRGAGAREYLAGRGYSEEMVAAFGLGFAPDSWDDLLGALLAKGVSVETAIQGGLARPGERGGQYDWFRNRVIFPIMDASGRVIAFAGRTLDADEPIKYINSPDTPLFRKGSTIYGIHLARQAMARERVAVVVEGYTDVIALHQAGIRNTVAGMGTALTAEHLKVLQRYVEEVILCYDADAAGVQAAIRNAELFAASALQARIAVLPRGQDPDEVVRSEGPEAFDRRLRGAPTVAEFELQQIFAKYESRGPEGLTRAASEAVRVLLRERDRPRRDWLVRRVADLWARDGAHAHAAMQEAVRHELRRRAPQARGRVGSAGSRGGAGAALVTETVARRAAAIPRWREKLEGELLAFALSNRANAIAVTSKLDPGDLRDPRHQQILAALATHVAEGRLFAPQAVVEALSAEGGTRERGVELLLTPPPALDAEEVLEAAVAKLRKHRVEGLCEGFVVVEESSPGAEDVGEVDFAALKARILPLIDSGEITHEHPDFKLYQRLQARFHGRGSAQFVDVRKVITAEPPPAPGADEGPEQAEAGRDAGSEGS